MSDSEPMIKLEPGGQAPVLSYKVPDPTSYSGRNFIELQIPEGHFQPAVALAGGGAEAPAIVVAGPGAVSAALAAAPGYAEAPAQEGVLSGTQYDLVTKSGVYLLTDGWMAGGAKLGVARHEDDAKAGRALARRLRQLRPGRGRSDDVGDEHVDPRPVARAISAPAAS
jgi:hypothetical protein